MGYDPTPNTIAAGGLPHANLTYYQKAALDVLEQNLHFHELCNKDVVPQNSGMTVQWYRPQQFSAGSTTPTTEGAVGTSLSYSTLILQARLSLYGDYVTTSKVANMTAPEGHIQKIAERFAYMEAVRVDTLTRAVFDAESASTAVTPLAGSTGFLRGVDLRNVRHQFKNVSVMPLSGGKFAGKYVWAVSPLCTFDLLADATVGGFLDIVKYNPGVNQTAIKTYDMNDQTLEMAGTQVLETTNVYSYSSGGSTYYRSYAVGDGACIAFSLSGMAPSYVSFPKRERFKIVVRPNLEPSLADPMGKIGGFVSSLYLYGAVISEGPAGIGGTYRYKTIDAQSSIG